MPSAELAEQVIELAVLIAFHRRKRALSAKGRRFSPRAIQYWEKTGLRDSHHAILGEAFGFARFLAPECNRDERLKIAASVLTDELLRVHRPAGRPKHQAGLINSTPPVAHNTIRGRPPKYSRQQLQRLVAFVEGVRLKRFMISYGFNNYADVYRHVVNIPKDEAQNELRRAVSDAEALQLFLSRPSQHQTNLPRDPIELRSVLQNARRTIRYQLRPPASGG